MTTPRSAKEWARTCWLAEHIKATDPDVIISLGVDILCLDCARAFAAQETAAIREQFKISSTDRENALQRRVETLEAAGNAYWMADYGLHHCEVGHQNDKPEQDCEYGCCRALREARGGFEAALRGGGTG